MITRASRADHAPKAPRWFLVLWLVHAECIENVQCTPDTAPRLREVPLLLGRARDRHIDWSIFFTGLSLFTKMRKWFCFSVVYESGQYMHKSCAVRFVHWMSINISFHWIMVWIEAFLSWQDLRMYWGIIIIYLFGSCMSCFCFVLSFLMTISLVGKNTLQC